MNTNLTYKVGLLLLKFILVTIIKHAYSYGAEIHYKQEYGINGDNKSEST